MPEFENKSKINAYSENLIPTTAVNDFIDKSTVDRILTYYNDMDNALSEVMRTTVRISELDWVLNMPTFYLLSSCFYIT